MKAVELQCLRQAFEALQLGRVGVGLDVDPGACAPSRQIRRDHAMIFRQAPGEPVPTVAGSAKSVQDEDGLTLAAFRIDDLMIADLDGVPANSRHETLEIDERLG